MIDPIPVILAALPAFLVCGVIWLFGRKKNGKFGRWWKEDGYQLFLLFTILIGAVLYSVL